MDVSDLLASERPRQRAWIDISATRDTIKQPGYLSSNAGSSQSVRLGSSFPAPSDIGLIPASTGVMNAQRAVDAYQQHQTRGTVPKKVAFELVLDEDSKQRARIALRVLINPHDTTDSIVSTVKNFYGIYEGRGVSFEDGQGNTLIAKYENFKNDMVVYVRVIPYDPYLNHHASTVPYLADEGHSKPSLGEPFQMLPIYTHPGLDSDQPPSRPISRLARKRSVSPPRDRRSISSQKAGSRNGGRSRDTSAHDSTHEDAANGYSDSDNGHGSTTSSRRAKGEQFVTADISLENIMQDGRRMRPKFDSSELPLFVPPQVPLAASTSSISPQRRSTGQDDPSPFARPAQRPLPNHNQTLPSPQSSTHPEMYAWHTPTGLGLSTSGNSQYGSRLRERASAQSMSNVSNGRGGLHTQGILPTPDPTIASCISDEDVARQLIALGGSHGRTSASTADDAFSGIADVASSTGATSDSESQSEDDEGLPSYPRDIMPSKNGVRHPSYASDSDDAGVDDDYRDSEAMIKSEYDEYDNELPKAKRVKTKASSTGPPKPRSIKQGLGSKPGKNGTPRPLNAIKKSRTPASALNGSSGSQVPRKTSSASTTGAMQQLGADEEDLSAKPRCQRCRKSKKGCDRQRPCQRCKDAGIGIEGCVSEDEGNGRKGRYGRHMGVTIKKNADPTYETDNFQGVGAILTGMGSMDNTDKNKKRKR